MRIKPMSIKNEENIIKKGIEKWLLQEADITPSGFIFLGKLYNEYKNAELEKIARKIHEEIPEIYIINPTAIFNQLTDKIEINYNLILTNTNDEYIQAIIGILKLKRLI